jgi:hypothetical protein
MNRELAQRLDGALTKDTPVPQDATPVGKQTLLGGGADLAQVRARILALRQAAAAASAEGIRLLTWLLPRPDAVFTVEAFLATGEMIRDAKRAASWVAAVAALPDDAKRAYDAAIRTRQGDGLDAVLQRERDRPRETRQSEAKQSETKQNAKQEYDDIALDEFIAPDKSSDSLAAIIIGNAEGTRTPSGGLKEAYGHHNDPGNEKLNRGSFSLQGASRLTPREADRVQQERMAKVLPAYSAACKAAGLRPTDAIVLTTYFDLYNIKPALATKFATLMPELASRGVNRQNAIELRMMASQQLQSRQKWIGWENVARKRLGKKSDRITDAEFWGVVRNIHTQRTDQMIAAMTALGIRHKDGKQKEKQQTQTQTQTQQEQKPREPQSYYLTGSVGQGGDNTPADVGAVQVKLTELGAEPGPADKAIGPRTIGAINRFQQAIPLTPDGLIEVGKKSERMLFGVNGLKAIVTVSASGKQQQKQQTQTQQKQQPKQQPQQRQQNGMYIVGGYPSSRPAGNSQPQYSGSIITGQIPGLPVRAGVKMSPAIVRAASALAPYLPKGTLMTSGIRTDDHQARVIIQKAGGLINGDLWQSYIKANGGEKAREVAWVGTSKHRAGLAFDLAGSPFPQIRAATVRAKADHPEAGLHEGYVEKRAVHVNVDP